MSSVATAVAAVADINERRRGRQGQQGQASSEKYLCYIYTVNNVKKHCIICFFPYHNLPKVAHNENQPPTKAS